MVLIGINFTRVLLERKPQAKGQIKIKNNVNLKDVVVKAIKEKSAQSTIAFKFEFEAIYDPEVGKIELTGDAVYLESTEVAKKAADEWKKKKTVPIDLLTPVMNAILQKSHVEAIVLSRSVNLPPPVQLPKIKANK